jgi:hypothetical protein
MDFAWISKACSTIFLQSIPLRKTSPDPDPRRQGGLVEHFATPPAMGKEIRDVAFYRSCRVFCPQKERTLQILNIF